LFFLSGACGLIYEVVWVRMLVLVFGASVFAVSTVLAAFMAGLALGSAVFGRVVDRRPNGLRIYAWLELGVGVFALAFPVLLGGLDELYTWLYRQLQSSHYVFSLVRFLVSFLVLLVPTTLMGATLPVLTRFISRSAGRLGRDVGWLYAINTIGAATGCFAAAYLLMLHLGTMGTTYFAAGINLAIAAIAFVISGRAAPAPDPAGKPPRKGARQPFSPGLPPPTRIRRLVFWGFAFSGFAALGYEVIWSRLLCTTLRITTLQSISTILITFLVGLALGGGVAARFIDRVRNPLAFFGAAELALGVFGFASLGAVLVAPRVLGALGELPAWWGHIVRLSAVTSVVMLIPTLLMGMLFPVAAKLYAAGREHDRLGTRIGNIYAANTTGAIFGAIVTGFALIPLFGTHGSIQFLAGINIAIGATALMLDPAARVRSRLFVLGGAVIPIVLLNLFLPSYLMEQVFRSAEPSSDLLYYAEGVGGTVTVHERENGQRILRVNGAGEVPTDHLSVQNFRLLGNLPLLLHPEPEEVLVIAFGGGITLAAVELHRPRRIDCVEIASGVLDAAPYFEDFNNRIFERLDRAGIELVIDDGRNHVLRTDRRYDVIISDATHPATADSWVLYTEQFYRLSRRRLSEGGIFAQWLPLHGLAEEDFRMILRTFSAAFPHASLWVTKSYSVMLGTSDPLRVEFGTLAQALQQREVGASLREVDLGDPVSFLATLALDESAFAEFGGTGRTNTDRRPYISFTDRSRSGTGSGVPAMLAVAPHLIEQPGSFLVGASPADRRKVERRLGAHKHAFYADIARRLGDRRTALDQVRKALAIDPGEKDARRLLEHELADLQ
jgi:spermidine synthase